MKAHPYFAISVHRTKSWMSIPQFEGAAFLILPIRNNPVIFR